MNNPYFPVPFSPGMLQGSADARYPNLVPRFTLSDGSVLMPLAWFKDVKVTQRGAITEVRWRQDALDLMGSNNAVRDQRVTIATRYILAPGRISRSDTVATAGSARIARIDLAFATFSDRAVASPSAIKFARGEVSAFATRGFGDCSAVPAEGAEYRAPTGAFRSVVKCARSAILGHAPLTLAWDLSYNY
jgi:hypothetical protein